MPISETEKKYVKLAKNRILKTIDGTLKTRPMNKPVYDPKENGNKLITPPWQNAEENKATQLTLFEKKGEYCENS